MLITLSGLDGSGKTTLIQALRSALETRNHAVVVCHMNHDIGLFAAAQAVRRRLSRRGTRLAPGAPPPAPRAGEPGPDFLRRLRYALVWNKPLRRVLYLGDLLIFLLFRFYVERVRGRVLIMDRYFYDTLVDVTGPRGGRWARLLARITPTPSVPVLLDVSPEEAFARKREYSVEYLARRSAAYRSVFDRLPSAVVIDPRDVSRAAADLGSLVAARWRP